MADAGIFSFAGEAQITIFENASKFLPHLIDYSSRLFTGKAFGLSTDRQVDNLFDVIVQFCETLIKIRCQVSENASFATALRSNQHGSHKVRIVHFRQNQ